GLGSCWGALAGCDSRIVFAVSCGSCDSWDGACSRVSGRVATRVDGRVVATRRGQATSTMARRLTSAARNCATQGHRWGRCSVSRRGGRGGGPGAPGGKLATFFWGGG